MSREIALSLYLLTFAASAVAWLLARVGVTGLTS